jgi:ferredoxin-NADP reductase
MKVKGFLQDATGAMRVTKRREELINNASEDFKRTDNIGAVAKQLHPGKTRLEVVSIKDASPTAKTIRFVARDKKLPVFQAGQYISVDLEIGKTKTSRPYSISSAPYQTREKNPFVEITVRNNGDTFAAEFLCNVSSGDVFTGSMPHGNFYYEPLRDAKDVVAIAGGSGITPFLSMAKEIENGKLDCNLSILFGSNDLTDVVLKEELDQIKSDRVKIVHVIAKDDEWNGEKGYINRDIIKKYSAEDTTYFLCGPQGLYDFALGELDALGVENRRIRSEVFGTPTDLTKFEDYPKEKINETYDIKVVRGIKEDIIKAIAGETVAVALERSSIGIETKCRSGECGFCRSELMSGDVYVVKHGDGRREADKQHGFFHPCSSFPLSNLKIKIPIV